MKVFPGNNVRTAKFGSDYIVSRSAHSLTFASAFATSFHGGFFLVNFGTVNDEEPTIGDAPISGIDSEGRPVKGGQPRLLNPDKFDAEGRLWVAVKVTTEEGGNGRTMKELTVITTTALLRENSSTVAVSPMALLRKSGELHQIAHFNLRYSKQNEAPGRPRGQHFFWSV